MLLPTDSSYCFVLHPFRHLASQIWHWSLSTSFHLSLDDSPRDSRHRTSTSAVGSRGDNFQIEGVPCIVHSWSRCFSQAVFQGRDEVLSASAGQDDEHRRAVRPSRAWPLKLIFRLPHPHMHRLRQAYCKTLYFRAPLISANFANRNYRKFKGRAKISIVNWHFRFDTQFAKFSGRKNTSRPDSQIIGGAK